MQKSMYSLFDRQANMYLNPLHFLNDGEAMRWFTTLVNSKEETNVSLYPEHFTLHHLGTFDTESGNLSTEHTEICSGVTVKITEPKYTIKELIHIIAEKN